MVHVGTDGITNAVVASVEDALKTRELIKIKVLEAAPVQAREAATDLATRVDDAHVAQVIGRTIVLYRPFPEEPEIRLP